METGCERRSSLATQITQLLSLQDLDQRLLRKEQQLEKLHQQVAVIVSEKEAREREAEERQQRIATLESQHREADGQLKLEEEKIKEKRVRLNRVRNERELLVLQREIELMKESNGELEDNILKVLGQLEEQQQQQTDTQTRIEELQAQLAQETADVESQIGTLEKETPVERKKRDQIAADLDASLCARYERVFGSRGGWAVVAVRDGTCQGCHMHVPPHMCNQIQSSQIQADGSIFYCPQPSCGRILYFGLDSEEVSEA